MNISDFDYELPDRLIAQEPMTPREQANLMIVHKHSQHLEHKHVHNFPEYLQKGDVLVVNNTKVFRARLNVTIKRKELSDRTAELFLIKPVSLSPSSTTAKQVWSDWQAIGKPGKAFRPDAIVKISDDFSGIIIEQHDGGTFTVRFPCSVEDVIEKSNQYGSVPIPPYIKKIDNPDDYQTAYATVTGSVAAPTAGFHITADLLNKIKDKGIQVAELTLHVGLGTFLPVKTDTVEDHHMHSEWVHISPETADVINSAKNEGRRVIAIGTTTTRALEGAANSQHTTHNLQPFSGDVNIFITPGFEFKIIDGLLTNFHLPKSTLLLLVSAFAGKETIMNAYDEAVKNNYRFYSFGDAMFITK